MTTISHLAEVFVVQVELHNGPRRCKRSALSAHHPSQAHHFGIYHWHCAITAIPINLVIIINLVELPAIEDSRGEGF